MISKTKYPSKEEERRKYLSQCTYIIYKNIRNTINETQLNGLVLLNIHTDVNVLPEEVLNVLVKYSNYKLNLRLKL